MHTKDYVVVIRDQDGTIVHSENANGEYREMKTQIEKLRQALQIEMERTEDLREMLDHARRIAWKANQEALENGNG